MIWTEVPAITVLGNLVAVVAAALLPVAVLILPVVRTVLLPCHSPSTILPASCVDTDRDAIPGIPAVVQIIAAPGVIHIHIVVCVPIV